MVVLCGCCWRAAEGFGPKGGGRGGGGSQRLVCWANVKLVGSTYVHTYTRTSSRCQAISDFTCGIVLSDL